MAGRKAVLPPTSVAWVNKDGTPTDSFRTFMVAFAALNFGPFTIARNDLEASKIGVPLGGVYQLPTGGLQGRIS